MELENAVCEWPLAHPCSQILYWKEMYELAQNQFVGYSKDIDSKNYSLEPT